MRALPFVLLLWLAAGAAHAETWRVLHWDRFSMVAVDVENRRTTGLSNTALPVLELTLYPGAVHVTAAIGEQEIDCADQRVRTRTSQMHFGAGQVTGLNDEIQPWRDPGEERDRLLVRAICKPDGLKSAPSVAAPELRDAMKAHLAAATAPKSLDETPAWADAWRAFTPLHLADAMPSLKLAVQSPQAFVIAAVADDGNLVLLAVGIEKMGEMRYRFHEAHVGPQARGDVAAIWALREADCGLRRARTLAWAGFDADAKTKFAHDTNGIAPPFEDPRPGSSDDIVLGHVCGSPRLIGSKPTVSSTLGQAISAYRWFFEGGAYPPDGLPNAESWRDAYVRACGGICTEGDEEPTGSTASSWRAGARS